MPVIHFRHCERSAAIHGCALRAMDRHGLRPRDDEGILVISTSLSKFTQYEFWSFIEARFKRFAADCQNQPCSSLRTRH